MIFSGLRFKIRSAADRILLLWRKSVTKSPRLIQMYSLFAWVALAAFILSFFLMKESRLILFQALAAFYVIWQLWILARSKTLSWGAYAGFLLIGAWIIAPLNTMLVSVIFVPLDAAAFARWNAALVAPITEEMMKLSPLLLFLWISRRATSLSLTDYALIGGATGAGFQWVEETLMRLQANAGLLNQDEASGGYLVWKILRFLPSADQELALSWAGHAAATALCALGIGFAVRLRRTIGSSAYALPVFLLLWAIADHAVHNGSQTIWLNGLHTTLGSGSSMKILFVLMFIAAIIRDYYDLNRVRNGLTLLPDETRLKPSGEIYRSAKAFLDGPERYISLIHFYRTRRRLAFTLLYGQKEAKRRLGELQDRMNTLQSLASVTGVILLGTVSLTAAGMAFLEAAAAGSGASGTACVSCLQSAGSIWWDSQSGWAKLAFFFGAFILSCSFFPFWSTAGRAFAGGRATSIKSTGAAEGASFSLSGGLDYLLNHSPAHAAALALKQGMKRLQQSLHRDETAGTASSMSSEFEKDQRDETEEPQEEGGTPPTKEKENASPAPEHVLRFTTDLTRSHVHDGGITPPDSASPFRGKWNFQGLHNWAELIHVLERDSYTLLTVEELPENGIRKVAVQRTADNPLTGEIFSSVTYSKTIYPKHYTSAEIDLLGERALNKSILGNRLEALTDPKGQLLTYLFREEVVGPDGKIIGVAGRVQPDAQGNLAAIHSHCPYNHRKSVSFREISSTDY